MDPMFAPYCATCGVRRLLPVHRIVASDWERGGTVYLRCTCGDIVAADARPPTAPDGLRAAS
jgi:hypothetical protein